MYIYRSDNLRKKVCSVLECYAKTPSHDLRMYLINLIKEGPDLNFRELFVNMVSILLVKCSYDFVHSWEEVLVLKMC